MSSSSRRHVFSQLLVVTSVGRELHLHPYTAATRSWRRQLARIHMEKDLHAAWARTAVVQRGAAHWLYANHEPWSPPTDLCIVSAEVGTTSSPRVSLTELLDAVTVGQTPFLCVGRDGRLSVAGVRGMHVALWT
ncbi:hypothetical protein PR202_ga08412 [Eleusine coracana subsp. coracana]|uniref:Uncharacterized protein n=1 Tax=Eleusine coracana subsp. coracana TaxID=191504 RepID=A0AAV5C371_ELECO|nr:hypothetical protein PR202_ga08412 [Eleusine coracana subsp. coracana]